MQAEETEAIITEILKHEEAPHVYEESTPSSMDMKVDCVKGTEEDVDAKNDNKDEEGAEKDDIVAKNSTDKQDEMTAEITNGEVSSEFPSMKCEKFRSTFLFLIYWSWIPKVQIDFLD